MFTCEAVPRPVRAALAAWVGRLADRLGALHADARAGVVEAAGRTLAEAAEATLRAAFGVGRPGGPDPNPETPDWGYESDPGGGFDGPWADDAAPPAGPPAPRWSWRAAAVAGLHALAWWLRRHAPTPALSAAAAVAGAAVLLLG